MITLQTQMTHNLLKQQNLDFISHNWIHLSPINQLGVSGSSYCIQQFDKNLIQLSQKELNFIQNERKNNRKKFMIDLVLNHLSPDSQDFNQIDTFYNQQNCQWLQIPLIFDYLLYACNYYLNQYIKQNKYNNQNQEQIVQYAEKLIQMSFNFMFKYQKWDKNQQQKIQILKDQKEQITNNLINNIKYVVNLDNNQYFMKYFQPVIYKDTLKQCYKDEINNINNSFTDYQSYEQYLQDNQNLVEQILYGNILFGACNGFVIGESRNFIAEQYNDYLLRNVISWGDCIKINYKSYEMREKANNFAIFLAQNFDGLRIDNAHSTDNIILRQIIKNCRLINKNLLIMFEVFTGSQDGDNIFCQNNYGDCIVRESNNCYNCDQYCYLLRYSINAENNILADYQQLVDEYRIKNIYKFAPVVLYDYTHDNNLPGNIQSEQQKGNQLATTTICQAIDGIAYGTTQGVSTFQTEKISVVCNKQIQINEFNNNMNQYKQILYEIRQQLQDYDQIYAQNYGNYMTIERMNKNFESYIFIIQPYFKYYQKTDKPLEIIIQGTDIQIICQYKFNEQINDIENYNLILEQQSDNMQTVLKIKEQQPSVIILKIEREKVKEIQEQINSQKYQCQLAQIFGKLNLYQLKQFFAVDKNEDRIEKFIYDYNFGNIYSTFNGFFAYYNIITKSDIGSDVADNLRRGNWFIDYFIKRQSSAGYDIKPLNSLLLQIENNAQSSFKPLLIATLFKQSQITINEIIKQKMYEEINYDSELQNDVYITSLITSFILLDFSNENSIVDENKWKTHSFQNYIDELQQQNDQLSRSSSKASISTQSKYSQFRRHEMNIMFKQLKTDLKDPLQSTQVSIAAGYPHFMTGMFRTWGRDLMLSITGILTINNHITFARESAISALVSAGSLVRNGLLPNLFDQGRKPRYNCRDAVWYWMSAIFQYIEIYKDPDILNIKVKRIFLLDDEKYYTFNENLLQYVYTQQGLRLINDLHIQSEQTLLQIIQEVLYKHYNGIDFWEWSDVIDYSITEQGKHIQVYVDKQTGFIYGGSQFNCHTWMDKMGSNQQFGNKGVPATPRNGADIEINLCAYYVLQQLKYYNQFNTENKQFTNFVNNWFDLLENNLYQFETTIKHKQQNIAILNDCIYQNQNIIEFRPNYLIGLSYQEPKFVFKYRKQVFNAFKYLKNTNSIGLKTLVPFDDKYVPWYDNNDRSSYKTADGFSYHNGPEWGHCMSRGLICIKKIILYIKKYQHHYVGDLMQATQYYNQCLRNIQFFYSKHNNFNGDIIGYPELTNDNAEICQYSCINQAWALGALLEALTFDFEQ